MRWVGTPNGVVRTWTTKTLAEEDKWQAEVFESFVGLPWQLKMPVAREAGMKPVPDLELDIELPGQPEVPAVQVKEAKGLHSTWSLHQKRCRVETVWLH